MSIFWDDLKAELTQTNPARAAAMERAMAEARARLDRAVQVPCGWGNCVNDVDPVTGKTLGGFGPSLCPCENLPGWNSSYPCGQPLPAVPAKVTGRHGSRVQRSRRRHTLPDWGPDFVWLPPAR